MKLLLVSSGYPPTTGGVETVVGGIASGLVSRGVDVEVWVPQRGILRATKSRESGVLVRRFPSNASTRFQVAPGLYRQARRAAADFDVIHAHGFHNAAAAAVLLAHPRRPLVFTPHYHGPGHTPLARLAHRPYRPIGRQLFNRAAQVIAVSHAERNLIIADFPAFAGRCRVIHNGADTADIVAAEPFAQQPATAVVMGRLEPYKRIVDVIAAFDELTVPGQLSIIGDGPARGEIEAAVERMVSRRPDVRILGRIERDELHRWIRTASVVVSMSPREAFGLVAVEGAAGGARSILTDIPAHREVQGLLPPDFVTVIDGTKSALIESLRAALTAPRHPVQSVRSWDDVAAEHLAVYETARAAG